MTLRLLLPFGALALAAVSSAQFADQSLAVIAVGDGTTALSSAGTATQLQNFTKTGAAGAATVNLGIFSSGSSTSEGALILDGSGTNDLYAVGYTSGGASVSSTTGANNARKVARFNAVTGAVSYVTLGANDFSTASPRSAVGVGGTIYAAGAGSEGGVLVGADANGTADLTRRGSATTGSTNARVAQLWGSSLYFSTGSTSGGAALGINLANADGTVTPVANLGTGSSAYDFLFANDNTLFVADDRTNGSGGIYRFDRVNGAFGTGTQIFSTAVRHIAFDGSTLFATTAETSNNSLISVALDGSSSTLLASAGTNRAFRGVEVVPEPATMAAMALGLGALASRRRKKKSA